MLRSPPLKAAVRIENTCEGVEFELCCPALNPDNGTGKDLVPDNVSQIYPLQQRFPNQFSINDTPAG
ncbi:MAG: hypothetical protein R6U40_08040 [Desulfobacterales bacterium]